MLNIINSRAYAASKEPRKFFSPGSGSKPNMVADQVVRENTQKKKNSEKKVAPKVEHAGFVTNRRVKRLKKLVAKYGEKTRNEIIDELARLESGLKDEHTKKPANPQKFKKPRRPQPKKGVPSSEKKKSPRKEKTYTQADLEALEKKFGDSLFPALASKLAKFRKEKHSMQPKCTFCGKSGHTVAVCYKKQLSEKGGQKTDHGKGKNKGRAQEYTSNQKKKDNRGGGAPNTQEHQFAYMIDPYDQQKYKIPITDVEKFAEWARLGNVARDKSNLFQKTWSYYTEDLTKREEEFAEQELENMASSAFWQQDFRKKHAQELKQDHARTPRAAFKNVVQVHDENDKMIARGTLVSPTIVAFLKHFFKSGVPTSVVKNAKRIKILETRAESNYREDCWVFGRLDSPLPYFKVEIKVPTRGCKGVVLGEGDFEVIKVNLNADEVVYHGTSFPMDCARPVIDTDDNSLVGLHAGEYTGTGVAYGIPATKDTLLCFQSFL
jgi:hypothetical protein